MPIAIKKSSKAAKFGNLVPMPMPLSLKNRTFTLLLVACVLLLLGRAYQHLFFEAPYRSFFLKQDYFGWAVAWFSDQEWVAFVNDLRTDRAILALGRTVGIFFAVSAIATLLVFRPYRRLVQGLLYTCTALLAFMAFAYYLDKGFQFAQIMEYTAQAATPALLAWYVANPKSIALQWVLRLAIGLTFLGHGLYALGLYPVPGYFVHMVITNLGLTNDQAVQLLLLAGWMDVGVAIGVLLPRMDRFWLWYAAAWGFLTALARLTTFVFLDHMFWPSLHQIGFEFIIRTPHFLLPLAALMSSGLYAKLSTPRNSPNQAGVGA